MNELVARDVWKPLLTVSIVGATIGSMVAIACSGAPPQVDPIRSLSGLKAACAALNAPVTSHPPPAPPATGGTGGVVTVSESASGGAP